MRNVEVPGDYQLLAVLVHKPAELVVPPLSARGAFVRPSVRAFVRSFVRSKDKRGGRGGETGGEGRVKYDKIRGGGMCKILAVTWVGRGGMARRKKEADLNSYGADMYNGVIGGLCGPRIFVGVLATENHGTPNTFAPHERAGWAYRQYVMPGKSAV